MKLSENYEPCLITPEIAQIIGQKINPSADGADCQNYRRESKVHPSIKKGCAGCYFNRFAFCVAPNKKLEKLVRESVKL